MDARYVLRKRKHNCTPNFRKGEWVVKGGRMWGCVRFGEAARFLQNSLWVFVVRRVVGLKCIFPNPTLTLSLSLPFLPPEPSHHPTLHLLYPPRRVFVPFHRPFLEGRLSACLPVCLSVWKNLGRRWNAFVFFMQRILTFFKNENEMRLRMTTNLTQPFCR